jgi:hypothetical protein
MGAVYPRGDEKAKVFFGQNWLARAGGLDFE